MGREWDARWKRGGDGGAGKKDGMSFERIRFYTIGTRAASDPRVASVDRRPSIAP